MKFQFFLFFSILIIVSSQGYHYNGNLSISEFQEEFPKVKKKLNLKTSVLGFIVGEE
jgi:hypothetical protein